LPAFDTQLLETDAVSALASFPTLPTPRLTVRYLLSPLQTDLIKRLHHLLATVFLLLCSFREFDDHVHASSLSFACDHLFGGLGVIRIGGEGDDRSDRSVSANARV
jgi:hypothetical protein